MLKEGVSVLVPVYNQAPFLSATIESVLSQTYPHWELLIVDDCSTDESWSIIEPYARKDSRIRVFRNETNRGLIANWHFLIEAARGEFLAFLEGDDCFCEENLAAKKALFSRYPELALVYCNYQVINAQNQVLIDNGHEFWQTKTYQNTTIPARAWLRFVAPPLRSYSQSMIRKSLLEQVGYPRTLTPDEPVFLTSDWDFHLRVSTTHLVYGTEQVLFKYRRHAHNQTKDVARINRHLLLLADEYARAFAHSNASARTILYGLGGRGYVPDASDSERDIESPEIWHALILRLQSRLRLYALIWLASKPRALYKWFRLLSARPSLFFQETRAVIATLSKICMTEKRWYYIKGSIAWLFPVRREEDTMTTEIRKVNWVLALLMSIFFGSLGVDRFMMGHIGLGILKLVTFGGFGIWWLVDLILIASRYSFKNVVWTNY